MRKHNNSKSWIYLIAALASCTERPTPGGEFSKRDSAGVTIADNSSPAWNQNSAWRLAPQPSLTIEASDSEPEKGPLDPVSVFRMASGNIVVADGNQAGWHRLLIYNQRGAFLSHVSRKGEGPCEFGQLWWAEPYRGDSVAAFDMAHETVVVLSLAGGCSRSVRLPPRDNTREQRRAGTFTAGAEGVYPDGTLLVYPVGYADVPAMPGMTWYRHALLRIDPDGAIRDTLGWFRIYQTFWDGSRSRPLRYARAGLRALDRFDIIYGEGSAFELLRFDSAGTLKQVIRRTYTSQPVTHDDKVAAVSVRSASSGGEHAPSRAPSQSVEQRIARFHWAETKPAYSAFVVDTLGNIWVEEFRFASPDFLPDNPPPSHWSVFSRDGRWLGRVEVPGRFFLRRIYDDLVFGIWRDDDGVGSVRGYALIKPDN